jgi:hypothetical protein
VFKGLENEVKTPMKLQNYSTELDVQIEELNEEKQGLQNQLELQQMTKQNLFDMPEFDQNIIILTEQIEQQKARFKKLL